MNLLNNKLSDIFFGGNCLNRNEKKFILEWIISTAINTVFSGVFISGYVLYIGGTEAMAGIISSVSLFASIFQILFIKIWDYVNNKKKFINHLMITARYIIIMTFIISLFILITVKKNIKIFIFFLMLFFGYILGSMSGIEYNNWLMNSVKRERCGEFFSSKDRKVLICSTVIGLATSRCMDYFKKVHAEYMGFMFTSLMAAILSIIDFNVIKSIDYVEDNTVTVKKSNILSKKNITLMFKDKIFLHIIIYMCLWSFLTNITSSYYNVYMLKGLKLGYFSIMLFSIFQVFISVLFIRYWGKMANKTSWVNIFIITSMSYGIQTLIWFFVTKNTIHLIIVIYIISGLTSSGLSMASFNMPYNYIPKGKKTLYISFMTTVNSCMGFLGTLTGSAILSYSKYCKLSFLKTNDIRLNIIVTLILLVLNVIYGRHAIPEEK